MTTAARTLVNQVRDLLRDYGDGFTTLAAAISTTDGTTIYLASYEDVSPGMFLMIDDETMMVAAVYDSTPPVATVVRAQRGSTGATHTSGTMVWYNQVWSNVDIVRALNQAQDSAFPSLYQVVDDTSLTVAQDTYEYAIPATVHYLCQVQLEDGTGLSTYSRFGGWGRVTKAKFKVEYPNEYVGRKLRCLGYGKFDAMTLSGNLDTDFPDSNSNALEYLVIKATANLLKQRQGPIGKRDGFVGVTDSFQTAQPFMSTLSASQFDKHADSLLKQVRMQRIPEYLNNPGRGY